MPGAGDLRERVRFEQQALDDNGDRLGAWGDDAFSRPAQMLYLQGSEAVMSERLQGRQPVVIVVRDETAVRAITNGWRAVGVSPMIEGQVFNIQGKKPSKDRGFWDVTAIADDSNR